MEKRMQTTLNLYGSLHKKFRSSSPSPADVKAADIKMIVAQPGWQKIRSELIGTWKYTPKKNVSILRKWLGDFKDPIKVRQVLNYLTGTAFRTGIVSHPEITKLQNEIRAHWNKMNLN